MFTQCEKCKAIFRVNLREVTASQGRLRCGECYSIFDATHTLSNTMPTPFQDIVDLETINPVIPKSDIQKRAKNKDAHTISIREKTVNNKEPSKAPSIKVKQNKSGNKTNKWLLAALVFLTLLLPLQIYFNLKHKASEEPLHEPDKIQMLNYNVFAHPNEAGVLLISATIKNTAKFKQPYPIIEVRLSDSQSRVIALRRFKPSEYLQGNKEKMQDKGQQSRIKLKIKDPGSKATRFQFKFY